MMVREAVATYLIARPAPTAAQPLPVAAFLEAWRHAPRLTDREWRDYAADLREARVALPPLDDPWG